MKNCWKFYNFYYFIRNFIVWGPALIPSTYMFVSFCSFFLSSLTVVHKGRQWKSGGKQQKSSRAGQHTVVLISKGVGNKKSSRARQQNNLFLFQPNLNIETSPKRQQNILLQSGMITRLITLEMKYFWRINRRNWHFLF